MPVTLARQTDKTQSDSKRQSGWLPKLAVVLFWQLLAVLFVELVLFSAGLGEEEIFKFDSDLGTRHMTGKRVSWRTEGYAQSYFDTNGMREAQVTVNKPAGTYRIALLGDSLTEGMQVPVENTFGQILQRQLSRNDKPVQVLNFAVSGYSTVQEYVQLKKQVLAYQPDLVVVCYNNRDMFENWAPPDQVLSNVRPLALHLPGQKLLVSSGPVHDWLRSPRARFLSQIEWIRTHSRIYGLLAAVESDWAFHNPVYKEVIAFLTQPGKTCKKWLSELKTRQEQKTPPALPVAAISTKPVVAKVQTPSPVVSKAALKPKAIAAAPDNQIYVSLMSRTLGSLLAEMDSECRASGARLAVVALPVRAALCPQPQMETAFFNVTYPQELNILKGLCLKQQIPYFDGQQIAAKMTTPEQLKLFYVVHFRLAGQEFMARVLQPFFEQLLNDPVNGQNPRGDLASAGRVVNSK